MKVRSGFFLFLLAFSFFFGVPDGRVASAWAEQPSEDACATLVDRWLHSLESPQTPKFLKDRADQMAAEQLASDGANENTDCAALLRADANAFSGKFSSLIQADGPYYGLTRQMKPKYAAEFLVSGKMEPRSGQFGDTGDSQATAGVYFELSLKKNVKTFSWADAELHFDPRILDERSDYIVNPAWAYGVYDIYSASPALNPGRVVYYLEKLLLTKYDWMGEERYRDNEVVFTSAVTLEHLSLIVLPKEQREGFIANLRAKKVPLPKHWKDWESHIIGRDKS